MILHGRTEIQPVVTAYSVLSLLSRKTSFESPYSQVSYFRVNIFNPFNHTLLKHTNILQSTPRPLLQLLGLVFPKVTDVPNRSQLAWYFTLHKYHLKIYCT